MPPRTGTRDSRGRSVESDGQGRKRIDASGARTGIPSRQSSDYADQEAVRGRDQRRSVADARSGKSREGGRGTKIDAGITTKGGQARLRGGAAGEIPRGI